MWRLPKGKSGATCRPGRFRAKLNPIPDAVNGVLVPSWLKSCCTAVDRSVTKEPSNDTVRLPVGSGSIEAACTRRAWRRATVDAVGPRGVVSGAVTFTLDVAAHLRLRCNPTVSRHPSGCCPTVQYAIVAVVSLVGGDRDLGHRIRDRGIAWCSWPRRTPG